MKNVFLIAFIAAAFHTVTAAALAVAFVSRVDCVAHYTFDGAPVCVEFEVR